MGQLGFFLCGRPQTLLLLRRGLCPPGGKNGERGEERGSLQGEEGQAKVP